MKTLGMILMVFVGVCATMVFPNDEMSLTGMCTYYITLLVAGYAGWVLYNRAPVATRGATSMFAVVPMLGDSRLNFVDAIWMNIHVEHKDGNKYALRVRKAYFAAADMHTRHTAAANAVVLHGLRAECDRADVQVSWDTEIGENAIKFYQQC